MPELTVAEVARLCGGGGEGDAALRGNGVKTLDQAGPNEVSFVAEPPYVPYIQASQARALLVPRGSEVPLPEGVTAIRVDDPRRALAHLLPALYPATPPAPGVHPTAVVADGAQVAGSASVAAYAVVGEGTRVGE